MTNPPVEHRTTIVSAVPRPRLLARLDAALDHRLTSVIGGPGTGKTTLLAQWAVGQRTVRHTAAPGDSLTGLMQTIVGGIRPEITSLDGELSMAVDGAGLPTTDVDPARADAIAAAVCEHLAANLGDIDLTFIVDDVHLFDRDCDAVALLAGLVRHAPATFHLVLASRHDLPFPTNRLVIDALAIEIGTADLAFTSDEAQLLLTDASAEGALQATELARRTGGWAIATAFATRAGLHERSTTTGGLALDTERRLFDYFTEEVIAGAPHDTVEALVVAAAVPWLTTDLVDHLGLGHAGRRLADRHRTGIAMVPVADREGAVVRGSARS